MPVPLKCRPPPPSPSKWKTSREACRECNKSLGFKDFLKLMRLVLDFQDRLCLPGLKTRSLDLGGGEGGEALGLKESPQAWQFVPLCFVRRQAAARDSFGACCVFGSQHQFLHCWQACLSCLQSFGESIYSTARTRRQAHLRLFSPEDKERAQREATTIKTTGERMPRGRV